MNKKGFTLVEVLAVIAIIGMLAAVSFPAISSMLSNKEEEIESNNGKIIEQLKEATEVYIQMNSDVMQNVTDSKDICISTLISEGVISTKQSNKEDLDTSKDCIKVTSNSGNPYTYEYKKNCSCP